jgi:hypothetical protein
VSRSLKILEQKIKGDLKSLAEDVDFFVEKYKPKADLAKMMLHIHDACSGGDFESASHKVDHSRYLTVTNAINQLRSELPRHKL